MLHAMHLDHKKMVDKCGLAVDAGALGLMLNVPREIDRMLRRGRGNN